MSTSTLQSRSAPHRPPNFCSSLPSQLALLIIYDVFFHPLAGIPGPFWAKVTDLWHARQMATGVRHKLLYRLHQKYGPLVRLGPNTVSVDTVEGLNKIFSATAPIDKSPFYQSFTPGFKSSFSSTGSVFKEKKSILAQAFSQKKLDAMESSFMHHTNTLCRVLKTDKEAELDESLSAFTIDILSDVCFGESFDLLHHPEEKKNITRGTLWRWPILQKTLRAFSHKFSRRDYPAHRAIGAMIKQKQKPSGREDIFNYLLSATQRATGRPFPDSEMFGEAIVLFVAGSDTTSTSLLTILWHLMSDKRAYDALANEIRSNFKSIDEINYQEAQHLPYLRAVIEEGLRILPPNSGFIPRQVMPHDTPFTLHDRVLPVGTEIGVANLALHRNPLYFSDPDDFVPERWIKDGKIVKAGNAAFSPFSKGPRSCLGRTMAYMEMTLVLAALFLELDIEFKDPEAEAKHGFGARDAFVLVRPMVNVIVKPRGEE
ncbi:cytochrome P450 [Staphylotrichum tortipilum]|uniref:Cytochrome P450 n=1 Tax=Staphylotrichum tortipilum TaxID=2831512 RepID=A0AAN6MAM7_9PEZI|nr:cytochrome P450 [Staphylotrichum longicolle]